MQKIITVIAIVISFTAYGQNHFIGIQGGICWTNASLTNFKNNDTRTGFHSGLTYQYYLNKRFNLGIDILYFQKGFTNDVIFTDQLGNPTGEKATSRFNYDYLSIPLKGGIVVGNKFSGFANLGIVPSFLIDATTKHSAIEGFTEETSSNITNKVTKFDVGGLIEIGAKYKVTANFVLSASFGFQHSFTSITNDNYFSNAKIRHYGMIVSIGLKYALKKK